VGRPRDELRPGLRSAPYKPYIVFFSYHDDEAVEIVRVLHGARDLTEVFEREEF
jgi:toxin ParE1/3/4